MTSGTDAPSQTVTMHHNQRSKSTTRRGVFTRDTFLHLRKRRYRYSCGKRFFEKNTFLPRYYRVTTRLVAEIIFAFKKVVSAKEIGCRYNVSAMTAMRYFDLFKGTSKN